MCQKESWEAIFATTEAHSTQRDQPPRMHGPGLWMYEQREQRVTPVRMIGVTCILWCPGWDGKDLGGRLEQDPGYTARPWHQYGISDRVACKYNVLYCMAYGSVPPFLLLVSAWVKNFLGTCWET